MQLEFWRSKDNSVVEVSVSPFLTNLSICLNYQADVHILQVTLHSGGSVDGWRVEVTQRKQRTGQCNQLRPDRDSFKRFAVKVYIYEQLYLCTIQSPFFCVSVFSSIFNLTTQSFVHMPRVRLCCYHFPFHKLLPCLIPHIEFF